MFAHRFVSVFDPSTNIWYLITNPNISSLESLEHCVVSLAAISKLMSPISKQQDHYF